MISLLRHLRLGLRLALFRTVHATSWRASVGALLSLLIALVALSILFDWINQVPQPAAFNPLALRDALWDLPLLLLLGWLAAGPFARAGPAGPGGSAGDQAAPVRQALRDAPVWPLLVPIAWLSASIVLSLVVFAVLRFVVPALPDLQGSATDHLPAGWTGSGWTGSGWALLILWQALIALRLFRHLARLSWISALVLTVPLIASSLWTLAYPPLRFWYADATALAPEDAQRESAASEDVLQVQANLLDEHLNALEPHRPGIIDLYFVGFAPYAGQDVFRKELDTIVPLMEQRFDAAGHTLRLVNSVHTLKEYPFATISNLRRALMAIARKIDTDEDLVMLYLTSHGSRNHLLAIEHPPLDLYSLDAAALRSMLEQAGIRNRVIVISACYSGGFVEPLRGESTLIMTAADADRKSFGCSDDAQLTYFGRALFDEQLRRSHSFEQAFADALPKLREREETLNPGKPFSNPRIELGSRIRETLRAFERQLSAAAPR